MNVADTVNINNECCWYCKYQLWMLPILLISTMNVSDTVNINNECCWGYCKQTIIIKKPKVNINYPVAVWLMNGLLQHFWTKVKNNIW